MGIDEVALELYSSTEKNRIVFEKIITVKRIIKYR